MEVISALLVLLGVSQLRDFTVSCIAEDYPLYSFHCLNHTQSEDQCVMCALDIAVGAIYKEEFSQSLSNRLTL